MSLKMLELTLLESMLEQEKNYMLVNRIMI